MRQASSSLSESARWRAIERTACELAQDGQEATTRAQAAGMDPAAFRGLSVGGPGPFHQCAFLVFGDRDADGESWVITAKGVQTLYASQGAA